MQYPVISLSFIECVTYSAHKKHTLQPLFDMLDENSYCLSTHKNKGKPVYIVQYTAIRNRTVQVLFRRLV